MSATLKAKQISTFLNHAPVITVPGRGFPVECQRRHPCFLLPDAATLLEEGHNVLLFQPGKQEIDDTIQNLKELLEHDGSKAVILPLHSELSISEQSKVFRNYPLPKAVVATDIAQTSLTIDDIDAVIDSGIKKEVRLVSGIEGLYPTEISTSECRQRAGRAGRVKKGLLHPLLGARHGRPPAISPNRRSAASTWRAWCCACANGASRRWSSIFSTVPTAA